MQVRSKERLTEVRRLQNVLHKIIDSIHNEWVLNEIIHFINRIFHRPWPGDQETPPQRKDGAP